MISTAFLQPMPLPACIKIYAKRLIWQTMTPKNVLLGALFGLSFQFMLDGGGAYKKGGSKRITDPTKRKARKKGGDLLFDTKGNQVYLVSASYFKRIKK
jgi:phytoene dehydrogenase-like protein